MNPTRLEQLLLLEQSGELTEQQRRALDTELAASASARQLRAELRGLTAVLAAPPPGPSPDAAAKIAARLAPTPTRHTGLAPLWKPLLAAAAALALLLGIQAYRGATPPHAPVSLTQADILEDDDWTDPLDAEFDALEDLLLAILDDPFDYMEL